MYNSTDSLLIVIRVSHQALAFGVPAAVVTLLLPEENLFHDYDLIQLIPLHVILSSSLKSERPIIPVCREWRTFHAKIGIDLGKLGCLVTLTYAIKY